MYGGTWDRGMGSRNPNVRVIGLRVSELLLYRIPVRRESIILSSSHQWHLNTRDKRIYKIKGAK